VNSLKLAKNRAPCDRAAPQPALPYDEPDYETALLVPLDQTDANPYKIKTTICFFFFFFHFFFVFFFFFLFILILFFFFFFILVFILLSYFFFLFFFLYIFLYFFFFFSVFFFCFFFLFCFFRENLKAREMGLYVRFKNMEGHGASVKFPSAQFEPRLINPQVEQLFRQLVAHQEQPIRQVCINFWNMQPLELEPDMFNNDVEYKTPRIASCTGAYRGAYGKRSVKTGTRLLLEQEAEVPGQRESEMPIHPQNVRWKSKWTISRANARSNYEDEWQPLEELCPPRHYITPHLGPFHQPRVEIHVINTHHEGTKSTKELQDKSLDSLLQQRNVEIDKQSNGTRANFI